MNLTWTQKPPLGVPINWGHPDAKGLQYAVIFQEGSGTRASEIVNGGAATIAIVTPPYWKSMDDGACFYGNSANYVTMPWRGVGTQGAIEVKFQLSATSTNRYVFDSNPRNYMYIQAALIPNASIGGQTLNAVNACVINKPYHYVITWGGGLMQCYMNGVLESSAAKSPAVSAPTELVLGARYNIEGGSFWTGGIDFFRQYNRFLSESEVVSRYSRPYAMFDQQRLWAVGGGGIVWRRRVIVTSAG